MFLPSIWYNIPNNWWEVENMETDRFVMVETTNSDKLFKFNHKPQENILVDFPDGVIIGVTIGISNIGCYLPDENEIYRYAGDIGFKAKEKSCEITVHSQGIEQVSFNHKHSIEIPFASKPIVDISVSLNGLKTKASFDRFEKELK